MNNASKLNLVKNFPVKKYVDIKQSAVIPIIKDADNPNPIEKPKPWEWEAPPLYSKFLERVSDTINLGAFTTDVAVPLGLIADSAGMVTAGMALSLGAGMFRFTKGGLETAAGVTAKKIPHLVSGVLDIGIGACTLMAGFGIFPVTSMLSAVGLLGMRTAYGEASGSALAQAFGKKVVKTVALGAHFIGDKFSSLFNKQLPGTY